ncbi:MAG: LamG-like jellyroll fold domain-containing protein [Actinomycetota bacterium]
MGSHRSTSAPSRRRSDLSRIGAAVVIVFVAVAGSFVLLSAERPATAGPGNLVMVTGNGTTSGGNDPAKRALFESWGWTVTAIDDSSSSAAFASAASSNDVMFVSDSSGSAAFGDLRGLDIGIVNEKFTYISSLMHASSSDQTFTNATSMDIIDNSHYITSGFSTGSLTIHSSADDVNGWDESSSALPSGVQELADSPGSTNAVLWVADTGAALYSGNNAVNRRVWFPSDAANPSNFTSDYETILERSLDWAAGFDAPASIGNLLFVTVDGTTGDSEDAARRALFESLGWTVTVIDDDAGLGSLTTAAAANDVMYISNTVFTGNTDLRGLDIGIVSEAAANWRDLTYDSGFAVAVASTTQVNVTDTSPYPTSTFSAGTLTLLSSADSLGYWNSATTTLPAAAVVSIERVGATDNEFLTTFETGDSLYGGNTAANRRVLAGWGSTAESLWTADMDTLVARTLEWAAGLAGGGGGGGGGSVPGNLVMVTSDGTTSTNAKVSNLAGQFAGWGWTVTAVDDDAGASALAAAAAANDVMFVSDSVGSSAGDAVRGLDIGIVNEDFGAISRLLYASSADQTWNNNTTVDVVDNSHPITSSFSLGSVTVHTSGDDVNYWVESSTALPAGVTVLADSPTSSNHGALFVADTGAALYSANTAANRRVWFPSDGADPTRFTSDYQTLLEQSLLWAGDVSVACGVTDSDSDGLLDCYETAFGDTDGDTTPNELDVDDDGDGTNTSAENADPNGDGDPRDAVDSDRDGQPDWLDIEARGSAAPVVAEQKISSTAGGLMAALDNGGNFGAGVTPLGDIDADGVNDVAIGIPNDSDGGTARGAVRVLFLNADGTVKAEQDISSTSGGLVGPLENSDLFGRDVEGVGDIDGDGVNDLAVGAFGDDTGGGSAGAIYLLFLNSDGTVKGEQLISEGAAGFASTLDPEDRFGLGIAALGDLDGNGVRDLAVGAPRDDDGGTDTGAVYVLFLAADGTVVSEQKISETVGGGPALDDDDHFGASVTGVGDLDGDGVEDLAVSAEGDDDGGTDRGGLYVLLLNSDGTVKATQKISESVGGGPALDDNDGFGSDVAGLGDLNGDGTGDLVVGAVGDDDGGTDRGAIYLVTLATDGTATEVKKLSSTTGNLSGPLDDGDEFGSGVAAIGDLDGDGLMNLLVGASGDDDGSSARGAVYVLDLSEYLLVNSTGDASDASPGDGVCDTGGANSAAADECTLRAAIEEANASSLSSTVEFAMPATEAGHSSGIWTIALGTELPDVTGAISIDAQSQTGWTQDPIVVLDGSSLGGGDDAFNLTGAGNTVRGFVVRDFPDDGINLIGSGGHTVAGNWIGLSADGSTVAAMNDDGIAIRAGSTGNTVGGSNPADRNVVSGNGGEGILDQQGGNLIEGNYFGTDASGLLDRGNGDEGVDLNNAPATTVRDNVVSGNDGEGMQILSSNGAVIVGNLIGVGADGTTAIGNGADGITINFGATDGLRIGGLNAGAGNTIAHNGDEGVTVFETGSDDNAILGNSIHSNAALGIDHGGAGVSGNDAGDGDTGPNDGLNFPVITAGTASTIDFTLDVPAGDYLIEAFRNPAGTDGTGFGEGEVSLGFHQVAHTGSGSESFTGTFADVAAGGDITLTATECTDGSCTSFGSTSEFSAASTPPASCAATDSDGDGLLDCFETLYGDTDGDTIGNELDADDDGDGTPTVSENPDPNGDGDPRDALDADRDAQPDYLDVAAGPSALPVRAEQKISDTTGGLAATLADDDRFGRAAASIGDLDGDGVTDLVVGRPLADTGGSSRGAIHVLFMDADGTVRAEQEISQSAGGGPSLDDNDEFGSSVAAVGDLDGDGVTDLAVGAVGDDDGAFNVGAVWVLFMNADGSARATQKISDTDGGFGGAMDSSDFFGGSVAGPGDVDGDGLPDLVVGASRDSDGGTARGAVYVLFLNADGTVRGEQKISDTAGTFAATLDDSDQFGISVAALGDLDSDGVPDIAVGANGDDDGGNLRGAVYVLRLNANGTVKAEQKISDTAGGLVAALDNEDRFGWAVAGIGDLDGDGVPDVAISADQDDDGDTNSGAVYLLELTTTGAVKAESKLSAVTGGLTGPVGGFDRFGSSLASLGDLDGDGRLDVAVGAEEDDDGGSNRGAVYVLGLSISCGADTDGDGVLDCYESAFGDTDGDTTPNELDADDDGDGTPTASENADPDGDGDPRDAVDSDRDGQPDWLDVPVDPSGGPVRNDRKESDTTGDFAGVLDDDDAFGSSIAAIGDLDGDGVNDLVVGAPFDDDGGSNRGAVYVLFMDSNGSVGTHQKISQLEGGGPTLENDDRFGNSVAPIGDLDGDGIVDLAVGAYFADPSGKLHVLFMNADGTARSVQEISQGVGGFTDTTSDLDAFGESVAPLGDLDGDGVPDLAVGSGFADTGGTNNGVVHVLFMNADGTVKSHQEISEAAGGFVGLLDTNDEFGTAVASPGDVDGDGTVDLAVTAVRDDVGGGFSRGAVFILFLNADGTVRAQQKIAQASGGLQIDIDDFDQWGRSLAAVGDVDGDGVPDIAVGTGLDDDGGSARGAVHLLTLNADGTVKWERKISDTQGRFTEVLDDGDQFGDAVTNLGDLDGDGRMEFGVGSPQDDDGGTDRGAFYRLELELLEDADSDGLWNFVEWDNTDGVSPNDDDDVDDDGDGTATASENADPDGDGEPLDAIDSDGDGEPDYLDAGVGSGITPVDSEVRISATSGGLTTAPATNDGFGDAAVGIGDVDGDGINDVAVGGNQADDGGADAGAVWILFMNADGTVSSDRKISTGADGLTSVPDGNDRFGSSIAPLGDMDGDGIPDIAVGALGTDNGGTQFYGSVDILFLNADGSVKTQQRLSWNEGGIEGTLEADSFGSGVANLGDLDGDGFVDIAVGAHTDDDGGLNRGAVWILFLNGDGTVKAEQKISATSGGFGGVPADGDLFGESVAALGDVDGDGIGDLAAGAIWDGASSEGAVYVLLLNADGTVKAEQKITAGVGGLDAVLASSEEFGTALAGPGDLDGDGTPDLVVGASGDDDGGTSRGAVYVLYLDADGTVDRQRKISSTEGELTGPLVDVDILGSAVGAVGDLDEDGQISLLLGAAGTDDGASGAGAIYVVELSEYRPHVEGTVFEDVDGDGLLVDDGVGAAGVDVWLFHDADADGEPSAGDTVADTGVTDPTGAFEVMAAAGDGTYWVVVDAGDIEPSAGFNGGSTIDDVIAEQTRGPVGAASFDGSTWSFASVDGARYGGVRPTDTDGFPTLSEAEHVTRVVVSGSDVRGLEHGFSFVPVTNTLDEVPPTGFTDTAAWSTFDPGAAGVGVDPDGYEGTVFDGRYVYFVPLQDGAFHGEIMRYDTTGDFGSLAAWSAFDPSANGVGTEPVGYIGGSFDGRYVYFAPYANSGGGHGEVLRYDTTGDFGTAGSWSTFDPGAAGVGVDADGYVGTHFDGRYLFFSPYWNGSTAHGEVLRYDTSGDFNTVGSWAAFDPGAGGVGVDADGFNRMVSDGRFLYFVPDVNGTSTHGEVLRYDLDAPFADVGSWAAFDPGANGVGVDPDGYRDATFDGRYVYFAPYQNGASPSGEVLRYDTTQTFEVASSWTTFDPSANGVGTDATGYDGAEFDGRYVYFAPASNSSGAHGEVLRYDTSGDFTTVGSWSAFDPGAAGVGTDPDGYEDPLFDGRYLYFSPSWSGAENHGEVLRYDTQRAGQGSLRQFIDNSNAAVGASASVFQIPTADPGHTSGVWTVQAVVALPSLADQVALDATSQPGWTATPVVELDGGAAGAGSGLVIAADDSTVQGLAVGRWFSHGIEVTGARATVSDSHVGTDAAGLVARGNGTYGVIIDGVDGTVDRSLVSGNGADGINIAPTGVGATVTNSSIGTDVTGNAALPNGQEGVQIEASDAEIGQVGNGNVISGNAYAGINAWTGSPTGVTIQANLIGVGADGTTSVPNGTVGPEGGVTVRDDVGGVLVGGAGVGDGNVIANNVGDGVQIVDVNGNPQNVAVLGNSIVDNTDLAIDLADDGVTPNDAGDGDAGPNDLLNFPGASALTATTVTFALDVPAGDYLVEAFRNPSGLDPSTFGEAEISLGFHQIAHAGAGSESFVGTFAGLTDGGNVTLAVTECADPGCTTFGGTSELSGAVQCALDSDGDGLSDCWETNYGDTDGDGLANENDADDDDDGVPTSVENADPNGDGDPRDALDSDRDSEADYLDTEARPSGVPIVDEQKISELVGDFATTLSDGDEFGIVTSLGDVDGDGITDLAVGAPQDDDGGNNRGAVYVLFLDEDGTVRAEQKISSTSGGLVGPLDDFDRFGVDVAGLGDLDGDGVRDLVVGARADDDGDTNRGAVYVLFLNADGTVRAEQKISTTTGGLAAPNITANDLFGDSVASIGDLDGDGIPDLAVGASQSDIAGINRGAVYVLFLNGDGTVRDTQEISSISGGLNGPIDDTDYFGDGLAGLGDVDGDGIPDLAVGAPNDDDGGSNRGAVHVLFLEADGTVRAEQKISSIAGSLVGPLDDGDSFGWEVDGAGDLDGDGVPDLLVAAAVDGDGGSARGAVYLVALNRDGTAKAEEKVSATQGGLTGPLDDVDAFGNGVATLGDLDGDGALNLAVGTFGDDDGGADRGAVYVLDLTAPEASSVEDSSVRRSDAELVGFETSPIAAGQRLGPAARLDGVDDRLVASAVEIGSGELSVSAWFNADGYATDASIVGRAESTATVTWDVWLERSSSSAADVKATIVTGGTPTTLTGPSVGVGTWHHVSLEYSGSVVTLYVDGVAVDSSAASGAFTIDLDRPVVIGDVGDGSQPFDGLVDEVRIGASARSAEAVALEHALGVHPTPVIVGAAQARTDLAGNPGWTVTGAAARSGAQGLSAPADVTGAWLTLDTVAAPAVEFDAWWNVSTLTGIEVAQGGRTSLAPIDTYESALLGGAGWDLARIEGGTRTQIVPPPGGQSPAASTWERVTLRIDQDGATVVLDDGTQVVPASGSVDLDGTLIGGGVGFRVGALPSGQTWYVDDIRVRRFSTPEPVVTMDSVVDRQ